MMYNGCDMKLPKNLQFASELTTFSAGEDELRGFKMFAHTGKPVNIGFGEQMVVDISKLKVDGVKTPILKNHEPDQIVGYSTSITKDGDGVTINGLISNSTEAASEVKSLSDEGFPWQASIGFEIERVERLAAKEEKTVNGLTFQGPGFVVTESRLTESSFVPAGADGDTSVKMSNHELDVSGLIQETAKMNWEKIKTSLGISGDMTDDNAESLILSAVESLKTPAPTPEPDATLVKLAAENRGMKLDALVAASKLSPAAKDMLSALVVGKDNEKVIADLKGELSSSELIDGFVDVLAENTPVELQQKSGPQLLELPEKNKEQQDDSLIKNMEALAATYGGRI